MNATAHFDEESLWAYALEALTPDAVADVERHMASCEDCAGQVGHMLQLASDARRWNVDMHRKAWREERLRVRLAAAIGAAQGILKKALEHWMAVGAVTSAGGFARARIGAGGLPWAWMTGGLVPSVASMESGVPIRGAVRTRGGGVKPNLEVATDLPLPDGSQARLIIEGSELRVRFTGRLKDQIPPAVLVVPDDDNQTPIPVMAEWNDFRREWNWVGPLPVGEFEVVVGPASNKV